jgi:diphosphomevalonate decarboxylase
MKETDSMPAPARVEWTCPSNIAIVKYWGKRPVQLPMNPSLSLTLSRALTKTTVICHLEPKRREPGISFTFGGQDAPEFSDRVDRFIRSVTGLLPGLRSAFLEIESENTFPHSSGIASSASAFGALALCLVSLDQRIRGTGDPSGFFRTASHVARLGSGSASRSLFGGFALWGKCEDRADSSDEHAIAVEEVHRTFDGLRDSILMVEPGPKKVSSSAGHSIMETHPYAGVRYDQARKNIRLLGRVLAAGDWDTFLQILEQEALTLHALMLAGSPGYMLMEPATLSIIRRIREFRNSTGLHVGFTLDAGANVHVLYDALQEEPVREFIHSDLKGFCHDGRIIHDQMGKGPEKISG